MYFLYLVFGDVAFPEFVIVFKKVLNSDLVVIGFRFDILFDVLLDFQVVLVLQGSHKVVHYVVRW